MSLRTKMLLLIMVGLLAAGFFYLRVLARGIFVESPKQAEETIRARLNEAAFEPTIGPTQSAVLYFPSLNDGRLIAESRPVTWAENDSDKVRQILLALIEGPRQTPAPNSTVQHNLRRPLPSSTNVRAVFLVSDGTAYVDFASDVLSGQSVATATSGQPTGDLTPGIATESLAIYSVVNSITANVPSVKKVKFLIQGQEVDTLDGHADLTEAYVPDPTRIQAASPRP
jgi:hypothetical protein